MNTTIYRLVKPKHNIRPLDGEGGLSRAGRWHLQGDRVVYASSSVALATLELMAYVENDSLLTVARVAQPFTVDERLIEHVDLAALPPGWDGHNYPVLTQNIGRRWREEQRSVVLRIPSARLRPLEFNYLINCSHPQLAEIIVGPAQDFEIHPGYRHRRGGQ